MAALGFDASQQDLLELTILDQGVVAADVGLEQDDGRLSLAQAIIQTLRHSSRIRQALWDVKIAQAQAHQARLLPNPVVSVLLRWPEGGGKPTVEAGLAAELLSLLKMPARIDQADAMLRAASAQAVAAVLDDVATVQTLYAQLQASHASLQVLAQQHALAQQMASLAQSQLDAGHATRLTATALRSSALQLRIEMQQQQVQLRQHELALARHIGRPAHQANWRLDAWSQDAAALVEAEDADESSWVAAALEHRPELKQAVATLQARGAKLSAAGLSWLSGEIGMEAERDDGNWSVGPSAAMALPIFDWGQAARHEARAMQQQAAWALIDTRRQIIQEVRQAHASWQATRDMLASVNDQLMPQLASQQQQTEQAFAAGQEDAAAVLLAQQHQQTAALRQIEWQLQARLALIALQRAAGGAGIKPSSTHNVTTDTPAAEAASKDD